MAITREASNNQPDHILVDKNFEETCFATSFFNFISDHNSIVVRLGGLSNEFTSETLKKFHFDSELHLKSKQNCENQDNSRIKKVRRISSENVVKTSEEKL